MAAIEHDMDIIERTLCDRAQFYSTPNSARTLMSFDREHGQFLLIDEGWDGYRRIHQLWAHIELRDHKFWVHEDGTEEGLANLLLAAGVPRDHIVLAFSAPSLRKTSEFAVA